VQSQKVIIMPDPKSRLRQGENPPYPEFAVDMVREFTKAISEQISPMREDVSVMKYAMGTLESQSKQHGEKLEAVMGMNHSIAALKTESDKHETKFETIDGHINRVKGMLWSFGAILTIIGGVSMILEILRYFGH
jgi:hypothetical protein